MTNCGQQNTRLTWLRRAILLAATLFPLIYVSFYVEHYGVDVPYLDEWGMSYYMEWYYQKSLTFERLLYPHNGHRLVLPLMIFIPLIDATGWNVRYELGVNLLCAIVFLIILLFMIRRLFESAGLRGASWLAPVVSLFVFSLRQHENWMWGWQLQIFLCMTLSVSVISLLNSVLIGWTRFAAAMLCGIAASFSFGVGLLVWPVGMLMLLARRAGPTAIDRGKGIVWFLCSITIWTVHRYNWNGWNKPVLFGEAFGSFHYWMELVYYVLIYIGSGVAGFVPWIQAVIGAIGMASAVRLITGLRKEGQVDRLVLLPLVAMILLSVGAAMMAGAVRVAQWGPNQAGASRYITTTIPFWVSLASLLFIRFALRRREKAARFYGVRNLVPMVGLLCMLLFQFLGVMQSREPIVTQYFKRSAAREALIRLDDDPAFDAIYHYHNKDQFHYYRELLEKNALSVFRNEKSLPPEELLDNP